MPDAFILAAVRTPIGKYLGGLAELSAPQLGALVLREALQRSRVPAARVDEVILGNVIQAGLGQNPARQAALGAGLPDTIAALTINKVCGSGLKAVMLAAQAIKAGDAEVILAGGIESMSRAPHLLMGARTGWKYGDQKAVDAMIHDGLWCAFENWHMGAAAEHIATKCNVSRTEQDRFAAQSHQRAAAAWEKGAFNAELLPVNMNGAPTGIVCEECVSPMALRHGPRGPFLGCTAYPKCKSTKLIPPPRTVVSDEGVRANTNTETLGKLKPAFRETGTVTAGNASMLSDGAAAVVVASSEVAAKLGSKPLARIVAYATSGIAPKDIFLAPVGAVRMVLAKAGLSLGDIDLFELNEAFAAQMLACNNDLKIDESRINVNGGAIALGHPIGASGTRVLVTLVHAMQQRGMKRGLASLCLGGGNAVAMIVERS